MMLRRVCLVTLFWLASCVGPVLAAPVFTCYMVARGDTAARIALRLTRNANNAYAPWFQLLDPATSRFVPKSQYNRIQPGWQACIDDEVIRPARPASVRPGSIAPAQVQPERMLRRWWAPVLFVATAFGWMAAQRYLERRAATARALARFGTSFIREFERPLLQQPGIESPLRSGLRLVPQRGGGEIWLAPNRGWHYPNLSDHRKNLEYDVERIVTLLGERRVICGPLGTRGPWVVIPFRLGGSWKTKERA